MPVPTSIAELSTTAIANSPQGTDSAKGTIDDYFRAHAKFIAENRDAIAAVKAVGSVALSIAALRLLDKNLHTKVLVAGYYAGGDGGGGQYYYDAADIVSTDNGGTVIVAADGARWKLVFKDWISVRQFGAQEGVDATTKIQATIDAAAGTSGVETRVPAGTWLIASPGLVMRSGTVLSGDGKLNSILTNSNTCSLINGGGVAKTGIAVRGLGFKMNFSADRGADLTKITRSIVSGCKFSRGPTSGPNLGYGVWGDATGAPGYDNHITHNEFEYCFTGVYIKGTANVFSVVGNTMDIGDFGVYIEPGVSNTRILYNRIEAMAVNFLHIGGDDTEVHFNYLEAYADPVTSGGLVAVQATANRTNIGTNYISPVTGTGIIDDGNLTTYIDLNKTVVSRAILPTGVGGAVQEITALVTLTRDSNFVAASATAGAYAVTLPAASELAGQIIEVIKSDVSANAISVVAPTGNTINGAASHVLTAQFKYGRYRSDGSTGWFLIGSN